MIKVIHSTIIRVCISAKQQNGYFQLNGNLSQTTKLSAKLKFSAKLSANWIQQNCYFQHGVGNNGELNSTKPICLLLTMVGNSGEQNFAWERARSCLPALLLLRFMDLKGFCILSTCKSASHNTGFTWEFMWDTSSFWHLKSSTGVRGTHLSFTNSYYCYHVSRSTCNS